MKNPASTHRIFLVDDHPVVRDGVRALLEVPGVYTVCGEAASPAQAMRQLARAHADCAIVDLMFRQRKCLDFISALRRSHPGLPVVVLSMLDRDGHENQARKAGAAAYVEKTDHPSQLLRALDRVFSGKTLPNSLKGPDVSALTPRERAIFDALGRGLDKHYIAAELGIRVKTVESHREAIKHKLGIGSSRELVRFAVQARSGN